jgi:5-(carboxyamino)imidazole ribonucleotide mutase
MKQHALHACPEARERGTHRAAAALTHDRATVRRWFPGTGKVRARLMRKLGHISGTAAIRVGRGPSPSVDRNTGVQIQGDANPERPNHDDCDRWHNHGQRFGPPRDARRRRTSSMHLQVDCEMEIVSAHRTPDKLYAYAREAEGRGLRVIIAGAGGAAHLPGMIASLSVLPVIGVPVAATKLQRRGQRCCPSCRCRRACRWRRSRSTTPPTQDILAAQMLATADDVLRERLRRLQGQGCVTRYWQRKSEPATAVNLPGDSF